jgi:LysR family transcriptional regulator, D-serine deaminase activator
MDRKQLVISNLYTFSVAAKCLSFTKAAEQLYLTQGAISQRIKQLEQQLGFKLFVRLTRKLELTEEGRQMWETVNSAFSSIFADIDDIKFNELSGELYIGIAPTFAQSCLMPKLADFQSLYPNLNLKIRVKASLLDFQHEPVDLAIYYAQDQHPDVHSEIILKEFLTPVCTPQYAEKHNIDSNISSLNKVNLIHCTESLDLVSFDYEWRLWLEEQQQDPLQASHYSVFNHGEMAISAARNHMGVAMGRIALIQSYLDSGELIAPFKRISAGMSYSIICPKGMQVRPKYKAFSQWLHRQYAQKIISI